MVYKWKTGTRYSVSAETAAGVMNQLAAENNLNAKALVDVSRPVDAPLHKEFEWDDNIAAEKWREQQGRVMIAMITVISDDAPEQETPVRAYFHIEDHQPNYEPVTLIIKDEDKTAKLFKQAMRELFSFQEKYSGLRQFKKLFEDIEELRQTSLFDEGA